MKRGEIYLAYLNPNKGKEVGKLRPILILQTDILNEIKHPTVIILPLTTQLKDSQILRNNKKRKFKTKFRCIMRSNKSNFY